MNQGTVSTLQKLAKFVFGSSILQNLFCSLVEEIIFKPLAAVQLTSVL